MTLPLEKVQIDPHTERLLRQSATHRNEPLEEHIATIIKLGAIQESERNLQYEDADLDRIISTVAEATKGQGPLVDDAVSASYAEREGEQI